MPNGDVRENRHMDERHDPDRRTDLGNPTDDVKPWPRWVRYPLIGIVVGLVVWAILTGSASQAAGAGLRVGIAVGVAIVVSAVLGPIGRRRREARSRDTDK